MKNKSNVFVIFKKWKTLVENKTNQNIKCLRSNNGGEYINSNFRDNCVLNVINMVNTIFRTPQENGVAKWMN